jgi:putative selenate reductase molybdopterin-binding subunit
MAAEYLGCQPQDIVVYSSDTDFTPFDKGAYASSTTYVSGGAVARAAEKVAAQIKAVAAEMLNVADPQQVELYDGKAWAAGRSVSLGEVALYSLHTQNQHQIMAVASYITPVSPPPFAVQFAEVTVDTETGQVNVERLLIAIDCGKVVNPLTASGQSEGGMHQALGYGLSEEMVFDATGRCLNPRFDDYRIFRADEVPPMQTIFVETFEPSHPFGVKSVAEISMDAVAPAVGNAVLDAIGVLPRDLPLTPEKIWRAMREAQKANLCENE